MKKLIALLLALSCMFGLVACGADKHTCRPLEYEEIFDHKTTCEPFVTDEERDELLNKAIRKYLDDFDHKSDSFTYEIISTHWGVFPAEPTSTTSLIFVSRGQIGWTEQLYMRVA